MSTKKLPKNSCPYCGNNPINHAFCYTMETLNVFLDPVSRRIDNVQNRHVNRLLNQVTGLFGWFFEKLGLLQFHRDSEKTLSDRSKVIWEEAEKRDILMEGIMILGRPIEQHRAKINGRWHYFESLPVPPQFNHESYSWMDDKGKLKNFFKKHRLPSAFGGHTASLEEALKIFRKGRPPFIVKPRLGSRGRHTTTHIYSEAEFIRAFKIAKQLCRYVIAEEHLVGSVYRGTYINGEVVGILRGDPPRIVGDGKHIVKELIKIKNKKKHPKVSDVKVTPHLEEFLRRQNLSLKTIPTKGKTVDLSEKIGISYGGFSAEEIPITHPKIITQIKKAGDVMGSPVVGFDFIIQDITKDPDKQRWGIIEANSLPFIDLHHFPLEGKPINVAAKIWDLWQ